MRGDEGLKLLVREVRRIDVLAGWRGVNGQERFALVVERRRDRSLVEAIECQEIPRYRIGCLFERRPCRDGARVTLVFVDVLEDEADLQKLCDRLPFSRRQM